MRHTVLLGIATALLSVLAFAAGHEAMATQTARAWLATVLLGTAGLIVACAAVAFGIEAARTAAVIAVYGRRHLATHGPAPRPLWPSVDPSAGALAEFHEWDAAHPQQEAEAVYNAMREARRAAEEADAPLPERAAAGVEAVRPLPATKPLPIVDAAAVLPGPVPFAVRYEFDADGARTVVPELAGRWAA